MPDRASVFASNLSKWLIRPHDNATPIAESGSMESGVLSFRSFRF